MSSEEIKSKSQNIHTFFHGDAVIWIVFFLLCAISVVEIYSATSTLSYKDGHYWAPVLKHAGFLGVGFIVVFLVHSIPFRWFKLYPIFFYPISMILLIVVLVSGKVVNNAARGIPIFGVNVQPSELAKGVVMIAVAFILSTTQTPKGADKYAFKYILWVTVPICLLIAPENLSTSLMLFFVVLLMMFIGHVPYAQMGKLLGFCAILAAFALSLMKITPDSVLSSIPKGHRLTTWKHRIFNFVSSDEKTKETSPEEYNLREHAQESYSQIAIATSNVVGKLPGNSVQRDFLSQAYSDFIYAIIIEELGLVGGIVVALLYIILLYRAGKIARQCERNFPAFLVIGLTLLIVIQAMVNMCVAVGLVPVTGQPLPLISRGGASILINCVYIGMLLSVSRFAKKKTAPSNPYVNEEEFQRADGIN